MLHWSVVKMRQEISQCSSRAIFWTVETREPRLQPSRRMERMKLTKATGPESNPQHFSQFADFTRLLFSAPLVWQIKDEASHISEQPSTHGHTQTTWLCLGFLWSLLLRGVDCLATADGWATNTHNRTHTRDLRRRAIRVMLPSGRANDRKSEGVNRWALAKSYEVPQPPHPPPPKLSAIVVATNPLFTYSHQSSHSHTFVHRSWRQHWTASSSMWTHLIFFPLRMEIQTNAWICFFFSLYTLRLQFASQQSWCETQSCAFVMMAI